MNNRAVILLVCSWMGLTTLWADSVIGTTNPNAFTQDSINWCQYGCKGNALFSPQAWVSANGQTGTVGVTSGDQPFYNLQQSTTWHGNFPSRMGLIYNGSAFGNTPESITTNFDAAVWGVGAWIQTNTFGPFTATITLYDQTNSVIGSYTATGYSNRVQGTALFVGAESTTGGVYGVEFVAFGGGRFPEPDFAIGTVKFDTTPEPSTLLLFGSSAVSIGAVLRKRVSRNRADLQSLQ